MNGTEVIGSKEENMTHVRVMERRPPPAPARAWAMLSPCCAVEEAGTASRGWSTVFDMVGNILSCRTVQFEKKRLSAHIIEQDIYLHMHAGIPFRP